MISPQPLRFSSAFTLVELLVTVAIIAILAVVATFTVNPVQLLAQSRDANRVADLATLNGAVRFYQSDQLGTSGFSLGNASSVYVSLPDATLTGNTTSTCTSLGLPALPAGYNYQCSSPQSYRDVDGTGWLPINFTATSVGSSMPILPIDPKNQSSTGLYYTYYTDGSQFVISAIPESQKEKTAFAQKPFIPNYPGVIANGTNVAISPLYSTRGLIGYWPMDDGSGTLVADMSGFANNGTWAGTAAGSNSTYYTTGKVGSYAGVFNGTNNSVSIPSVSMVPLSGGTQITIMSWFKGSLAQSAIRLQPSGFILLAWSNPIQALISSDGSTNGVLFGGTPQDGNWHLLAMTWQANTANGFAVYIDGKQTNARNSANTTLPAIPAGGNLYLGAYNGAGEFTNGSLDDVRVYSRALSASEIQAIYNAEK